MNRSAYVKKLVLLLALFLQEGEVARIEAKIKAARPPDDELGFYRHDWAPSLKEAKARAAKENRPVFFTAVTNISGPDTFVTGHC